MAAGTYGKYGVARFYALLFGVAYVALAAIELLVQRRLANSLGIQFVGLMNAVNWVVGVVLLAASFGTEKTARFVDRVMGFLFLALTIWGYRSPGGLGSFLGFPGNIPAIYTVFAFVTAIGALFAGFASRGADHGSAKSKEAKTKAKEASAA